MLGAPGTGVAWSGDFAAASQEPARRRRRRPDDDHDIVDLVLPLACSRHSPTWPGGTTRAFTGATARPRA